MRDGLTRVDVTIYLWEKFVRPFKRKKRCPDCMTRVLYGARVCQYCRYRFDQ